VSRTAVRIAGFVLLAAASIAHADADSPAVLDALFPDGRRTEGLAALAATETLAPDESFRLKEIGRDAHSSHHLVWIRDREIPHRHDTHDLFVVILRGSGVQRIGDEERPVGEGSVIYVPRGTVHAFRNASGGVASAYAVYVPPFDGRDRVEVK
jgi:mannose-6-phosphate isomerase-like protein (cupin superfamily)